MVLGGLGWGIFRLAFAPPPPVISDAGAVVLAVTAPVQRVSATATAQPTATPQPTATTGPLQESGVASSSESRRGDQTAPEGPTARPTARTTVTPLPPPSPTPTPSGPPAATDPPSRIVAPDIKLDADVVPMNWEMVDRRGVMVSEWVVPANAAGWHANSALPGNGENVVLSGHNNIDGKVFEAISMAWDDASRARVDEFTDRSDILKGRQIRLFSALGRPVDYTITDFFRLRDSGVTLAQRIQNARFMEPTDDSQLTLVTCWPPWSNTHRLVVIAKPVQP